MRKYISIILNVLIVVFTGIGTYLMFDSHGAEEGLIASGFENLKYFTVLSNELCGITALLWLISKACKKRFPTALKLMAASAAALTFLTVVAFLAPMYPDMDMYARANLWFHLIIPLTAAADLVLLKADQKPPLRDAVISALAALVYGTYYLVNILINGVGEYPHSNDWYGFLNWGYGVGAVIFAAAVLINFAAAALLRALNILANKRYTDKE